MSKLYTDSVHYNCKKAHFSRNLKKMKILDFFYSGQNQRILSQSVGLDLSCLIFKYLMMYLFDFTVIITQKLPNISVFVFIISNTTGLIYIK